MFSVHSTNRLALNQTVLANLGHQLIATYPSASLKFDFTQVVEPLWPTALPEKWGL